MNGNSGNNGCSSTPQGQQAVLGAQQKGTTPSSSGGPTNNVLGESSHGGSTNAPVTAAGTPGAPAEARATHHENGSLPFTGTQALIVLLLGCLALLTGVTVQRLAVRRSS